MPPRKATAKPPIAKNIDKAGSGKVLMSIQIANELLEISSDDL
jgi:hypothetical protein